MTQRELGERVAVSHPTIALYENGGRTPSQEVVEALCVVLGVTSGFFADMAPDEFAREALNFRDRITATERLRGRVIAYANLFAMVLRFVGKKVGSKPELNLPTLPDSARDDLDAAAEDARAYWGLSPDAPIGRMSRVLENAGIVLTPLRFPAEEVIKVDALSGYADANIVLLNRGKESTTSTRFDMAHELAHGVLHRNSRLPLEVKEREADRFASAFLMPARSFAREFRLFGGNMEGLLELKSRWGTSLQAIIVRGRHLGLLDAAEYRVWFQRISRRGWRRYEPIEPDAASESPELFDSAIEALSATKAEAAKTLADAMGWREDIVELVTGLTAGKAATGEVVSLEQWKTDRTGVA